MSVVEAVVQVLSEAPDLTFTRREDGFHRTPTLTRNVRGSDEEQLVFRNAAPRLLDRQQTLKQRVILKEKMHFVFEGPLPTHRLPLPLRPLFRLLAGLPQRVQYRRRSDRRWRLFRLWLHLLVSVWLRRSGFSAFDQLLLSPPLRLRRADLANALASAFQFRQEPRRDQSRVTLQYLNQ